MYKDRSTNKWDITILEDMRKYEIVMNLDPYYDLLDIVFSFYQPQYIKDKFDNPLPFKKITVRYNPADFGAVNPNKPTEEVSTDTNVDTEEPYTIRWFREIFRYMILGSCAVLLVYAIIIGRTTLI
mmetsp:Transcript_23595/g.3909  ORF Transcript_23595/g.3909 Transcript_23595/m.3909 type:complete len:126 (+) Transcript_23595:1636-2013(+)